MYRYFTLHVESDDPDIASKLARVIGDADMLRDGTEAMELHEIGPVAQVAKALFGENTHDSRLIAAWERRD